MHTSSKVLVLALCLSIYCWLSGSTALRERPRNLARTIPAGASVPVYGFYSDARHPALVTVEGIGCSADITRDCWGPDGKADPPSGPQRSKTLMQVDRRGNDILHATRGAYRALVACLYPNCNDTILSQRMVVGSRFISCGSHKVFFWSNSLRDIGRPYPSGNFASARGEFRFNYTPSDPEAVQLCASHPHAWFIPLS
jgi:hypothetical protein